MAKRRRKTPIEMARQIREMYATGEYSLSQLARIFNLTPSGISRIVNENRRKDEKN